MCQTKSNPSPTHQLIQTKSPHTQDKSYLRKAQECRCAFLHAHPLIQILLPTKSQLPAHGSHPAHLSKLASRTRHKPAPRRRPLNRTRPRSAKRQIRRQSEEYARCRYLHPTKPRPIDNHRLCTSFPVRAAVGAQYRAREKQY